MKKILVPFEGANFSPATLEFVRKLNESAPILLTAAFVPEMDYANLWNPATGIIGAPYLPKTDKEEDELIESHSAILETFCRGQNIKYALHTDRLDFALPSIQKESRFADLMLVSSLHFFERVSSEQPNAYLKELLHATECPVLLLPDSAGLPENIILAYDGSPSSVYAIKQFIYLFPELSALPATLVYIDENRKNEAPMPDRTGIEEWAGSHFSNLSILTLGLPKGAAFPEWIAAQKNPWLVTGSFGRSGLSLLLSKSFVAGVIKSNTVPLFIAHP
ncbi:MAG: hypothetical protein P4L51_26690 [Puia sp.]|nr:hypothetical protein [Puia sp.]